MRSNTQLQLRHTCEKIRGFRFHKNARWLGWSELLSVVVQPAWARFITRGRRHLFVISL